MNLPEQRMEPNEPYEGLLRVTEADVGEATVAMHRDRMLEEMLEEIGNARVQFWACPIPEHAERGAFGSGEPVVVTVELRDPVAHCTAPGCGRTSLADVRGTPWYRDPIWRVYLGAVALYVTAAAVALVISWWAR